MCNSVANWAGQRRLSSRAETAKVQPIGQPRLVDTSWAPNHQVYDHLRNMTSKFGDWLVHYLCVCVCHILNMFWEIDQIPHESFLRLKWTAKSNPGDFWCSPGPRIPSAMDRTRRKKDNSSSSNWAHGCAFLDGSLTHKVHQSTTEVAVFNARIWGSRGWYKAPHESVWHAHTHFIWQPLHQAQEHKQSSGLPDVAQRKSSRSRVGVGEAPHSLWPSFGIWRF